MFHAWEVPGESFLELQASSQGFQGWVTMGAEGTEPVYTQSGTPAQTLGSFPRRLMAGHIETWLGHVTKPGGLEETSRMWVHTT